jgi:hypothetical protein
VLGPAAGVAAACTELKRRALRAGRRYRDPEESVAPTAVLKSVQSVDTDPWRLNSSSTQCHEQTGQPHHSQACPRRRESCDGKSATGGL